MPIPFTEGEKNPHFLESLLWKSFLASVDVTHLKTSPLFLIPHGQKHPRFSTFHFRKKIYVFREEEKDQKSNG